MDNAKFTRTVRHTIATLLATTFLSAGIANGDTGPPPTLREAIDAAYTLHPRRQVLTANEQEVNALSRRASSLIASQPSLSAGYKTDQVGSDDGYREWSAGVSLPLWKPGQRGAAADVANDAAKVVEQQSQSLLLTVAGEVRERMWNAALMKNNLELTKKEWDTAAALEQSIRRRVELGELARTDLLLARNSALTKQADYLHAQKELKNALQSYAMYTGMNHLPRRRGEAHVQLNAIPANHPQLAAAMASVQAARTRAVALRRKGGGAPELFVGGIGERGDSDNSFNNRLDVSVSIPLGTRAHLQPELARAERARAEAQSAYDALYRQLRLALSEADQEVASVEAEYKLAREQNELAGKSLQMARVAFDSGESSLLDLLRVQALAFSAERREKELSIARQRAIARYNQVAGVLP